ncbi:hypothetical protein MXD81_14585, partial [Microbacteriaceae bacterium K1510]|nr:hypothetical protein [Microbacteriaceae bacterium K1510]
DYFHVAIGSGKSHHVQVMSHLARLHQYIPTKLFGLLRRLEHSREKEAILIISPRMDEAVEQAMQRLVRRGHTVVLMDLSGETTICRQVEPRALGKEELIDEG